MTGQYCQEQPCSFWNNFLYRQMNLQKSKKGSRNHIDRREIMMRQSDCNMEAVL